MSFFRFLRIAILLLILIIVAGSTLLTRARTTDWKESLWVYIYPLAGDQTKITGRYLDGLKLRDFNSIEGFLRDQAAAYGHSVDRPVKLTLMPALDSNPPQLAETPNLLSVVWWTTRMRWWSWNIARQSDHPEPDIKLFVRFHDPRRLRVLERSVGLQKGKVGLINAFASRQMNGSNSVVITHELLHTLGASDKYDPANGQPLVPDGLAEPDRQPVYPQRKGEIMAVRVALSSSRSEMPRSLRGTVIGRATAAEIGMLD